MLVKRPMKAPSDPISDKNLIHLPYPIVGSPKLDGFRCIVIDYKPHTSSMKSFPNRFLNEEMSKVEYQGLDGEIVVGTPNDPNAFHNTSGPVRRIDGRPDFKFYVFDDVYGKTHSYEDRWLSRLNEGLYRSNDRIVFLEQKILESPEDVIAYEDEMLGMGYEGVMIRSMTGLYKEGRCSFHDLNIFKRKPFVECEATIVGFVEGTQNLNEAKLNEMGQMRRSSHKSNKISKNTLGSFVLKSTLWPSTFRAGLGEGYTQSDKQKVWYRQEEYLGETVTVKYQKYGSRDAPRIPSVVKIRPAFDRV